MRYIYIYVCTYKALRKSGYETTLEKKGLLSAPKIPRYRETNKEGGVVGVRVLGTLTGIALLEARLGEGLCMPGISLRS